MKTMRFRNHLEIKAELKRRGVFIAQLARDLGVSPSLVHGTLGNGNNNRRVLAKLLEIGIPARLLELPEDMKAREAA